jgi:hypothetical protein
VLKVVVAEENREKQENLIIKKENQESQDVKL